MRALCVKQPYASWLVYGRYLDGKFVYKTIEARSWGTNYRGPVVVCASKKVDGLAMPVQPSAAEARQYELRGVALGVVTLYGVRPLAFEDEARAMVRPKRGEELQAWEVRAPQPFKRPFPVDGQLGLFDLDDARVQAALEGAAR